MTPILRGTASRLGLRKTQPEPTRSLRRAQRRLIEMRAIADERGPRLVSSYLWRGFANGILLEWVTTDPDLVLYVKPTRYGAELVDQDWRPLMGQWRAS